jgi:hypothetical protein
MTMIVFTEYILLFSLEIILENLNFSCSNPHLEMAIVDLPRNLGDNIKAILKQY